MHDMGYTVPLVRGVYTLSAVTCADIPAWPPPRRGCELELSRNLDLDPLARPPRRRLGPAARECRALVALHSTHGQALARALAWLLRCPPLASYALHDSDWAMAGCLAAHTGGL